MLETTLQRGVKLVCSEGEKEKADDRGNLVYFPTFYRSLGFAFAEHLVYTKTLHNYFLCNFRCVSEEFVKWKPRDWKA